MNTSVFHILTHGTIRVSDYTMQITAYVRVSMTAHNAASESDSPWGEKLPQPGWGRCRLMVVNVYLTLARY